jgi:hypothetical protein
MLKFLLMLSKIENLKMKKEKTLNTQRSIFI